MKRGFTLVELVVALAVSSILIALIGTSFYFITRLSTNVITNSNNNYKLFSVRDYIIANVTNDDSIKISDDGDVTIADKVIASDSNIKKIIINDNKCTITYLVDNEECVLEFLLN